RHVRAAGRGQAMTTTGQQGWVSTGLNGNGSNADTPSAFQVVVAPPTPGAPSDALTTVYRVWQNRGNVGLIPESSADSGETYGSLASAGISTNEVAGLAPVLAVNPKKVDVNGQFYDELLFGTSRVYLTRTSSNVWDVISPVLSNTGFVSALAFAPSASGVYYAGTDDGKVFYQKPGLNWPQRSTGLPSGVKINGIMVDPNNADVAYVMLGGKTGIAHVFKTTNAGQSWTALGGSGTAKLPDVSAYSMVIDKRALPGAPNGLIYVGTDVGV